MRANNPVHHEGDVEEVTKPMEEYTHPKVMPSRNDKIPELKHTDPFAEREGKTLLWRNVNMTLQGKNGEPNRMLLDKVWGEVPEKETTAIMGASGAGKSSLLNILAGRASSRGRIKVEADIRLNNFSVDPTNMEVRKHIAFVEQDDSLQNTSTPREAIRFSAKLRLSRNIPDHDIDILTQRVLTELGLSDCADTLVGGGLIKGISGGERKRTSVGVEIVVKPALIYLDEPTSGLDSFSAVQLCQVLKKVANAGASVMFTIHQPSSDIFNSFDRLILLNKGRVMYQGDVSDVPNYFRLRGHPVPPNFNPADWIMNVAQSVKVEALDEAGFFPEDDRIIDDEPFQPDEERDALGMTITRRTKEDKNIYDAPPPGLITQLIFLFNREIDHIQRNKLGLAIRFGITSVLNLLFGIIFFDVGRTDPALPSNLNSHYGALVMVLMSSMFGIAASALSQFPSERPVFLREYSTNHYSVVSYFVSHFTVEALLTGLQVFLSIVIVYPMIGFQGNFLLIFLITYGLTMSSTALAVLLGASVEDPKVAQEMVSLLFVPQMLFAGFFVRTSLIPVWLRWPQYLCSLTYSTRLVLIAEFKDCGTAQAQCDSLLSDVDADPDEVLWYWLLLLLLFTTARFGALYLLRKKATKFY